MSDEFHDSADANADPSYSPYDKYDANDNPDIEVTDDDLRALKDEVDVLHGGDLKAAAGDLLEQKAMQAIISISRLATEASAERVRLDASKYIVERVLGPLSKIEMDKDPAKDPMLQFMAKLSENMDKL